MSIYLSISKMCSSLFSRGNQACVCIANAKHTTQSLDAALSAIYIEGTHLPLNWRVDLGNQFASLKTTVKFMTFVEEWWTHISWFYGYYRLDLDETDAKIDTLFCPQCVQMTGIFVFPHGVEAIFSAVCDHFWTKTLFSTSSFWGSNSHFLDDLDYLLCNVGVSFWFYLIEIHFF